MCVKVGCDCKVVIESWCLYGILESGEIGCFLLYEW